MPPKRVLTTNIPSGPSMIVADDGGLMTQDIAGASVNLSQIGSQLAAPRRRVLMSDEAVDEALQLTTQNKITNKNAWEVKLIEGIQDTVQSNFSRRENDGREPDQYQQFTRAANLVEGGAKVWTHRVEHTFLLSSQMVQRLLRNDGKEIAEDENEENAEGAEGQPSQKKKERKRRALVNTLAESLAEIDQPKNAKAASTQVSPMFRAITEKFDQGHAQGLLMNNTPFGSQMNRILDRDFSREPDAAFAAPAAGSPLTGSKRSRSQASEDDAGATPIRGSLEMGDIGEDTFVADFAVPEARLSQEIPTRGSGRVSGRSDVSQMTMGADHIIAASAAVSRAQSVANPAAAAFAAADGEPGDSASQYGGYDDDDTGGYADEGEWGGDDDGTGADFDSRSYRSGMASRVGSTARGMMSGESSLADMDNYIAQGGLNHADASGWAPLDENSAQPTSMFDLAKGTSKMMGDLRKGALVGKAGTAPAAGAKKNVSFAPGTEEASAETLAAKRKRKETAQIYGRLPANFLSEAHEESLKMNQTNNTTITPLGKKWLSDKKVEGKQYCNRSYCHRRCLESGNLLANEFDRDRLVRDQPTTQCIPQAPAIKDFAQPFCAQESHWNHLLKHKRMQRGNGNGDANTGYVQRNDDEAGVVEDEVAEMPDFVFDDDFGNAGAVGEDDNDAEYETNFDVPTAQGIELPDLQLGDFASTNANGAADEDGEDALIAGPELVQRLRVQTATGSKHVDVGRLRRFMWDETKRVAHARPADETPAANEADDPNRPTVPHTSGGLVFDGEEHRFSEVVANILPNVNKFSRCGEVRTAFFFFTMLFLVNEHGIDLQPMGGDDVTDLNIKGLLELRGRGH